MTRFWVLQGNPKKWDRPERLYSEPILGWSVTGIEDRVAVGDGVLIWMANSKPSLRGVYAAGKVSGDPRTGYPLGWGDDKQRATLTPFVPLAIHWYVVHNPVGVSELGNTSFTGNQIMKMARRTSYSCTRPEFDAAIALMQEHGPTVLPTRPGATFRDWWNAV